MSNDGFDVVIGGFAARVDPHGTLAPPPRPGVFAAVDFDEGTLDDPRDDDEEWDAGRAAAPRGPRRALRHAEGRGRTLWCVGGARRGRVRAPADSHAHDWWTPR